MTFTMANLRRTLLLVCVLLLSSLATADSINQDTYSGWWSIYHYAPIGQSFVAPLTNDLRISTIIGPSAHDDTVTSVPITMSLYHGEGFGGSLVGSTTIQSGTYIWGLWREFSFSGVTVIPGDRYTFFLSTPVYGWGVNLSTQNPYSGGQVYWHQNFDCPYCPPDDLSRYDLSFRVNGTAVPANPTPEPSTIALLGTGLLGLGWRRWRS